MPGRVRWKNRGGGFRRRERDLVHQGEMATLGPDWSAWLLPAAVPCLDGVGARGRTPRQQREVEDCGSCPGRVDQNQANDDGMSENSDHQTCMGSSHATYAFQGKCQVFAHGAAERPT